MSYLTSPAALLVPNKSTAADRNRIRLYSRCMISMNVAETHPRPISGIPASLHLETGIPSLEVRTLALDVVEWLECACNFLLEDSGIDRWHDVRLDAERKRNAITNAALRQGRKRKSLALSTLGMAKTIVLDRCLSFHKMFVIVFALIIL